MFRKISTLWHFGRISWVFFWISQCAILWLVQEFNHIVFNYLIYEVDITLSTNKVVDLGFIFDSKLCIRSHIENMSCKALKLLGFVKRVYFDLKLSIKSLYYSIHIYIYSSLCFRIWYSYLIIVTDKYHLKHVQ